MTSVRQGEPAESPPIGRDRGARPARRGISDVRWYPTGAPRRLAPRRYCTSGLTVATVGVCFSLTPSLLPRSPFYQGVVSGIVAALGYGLGVALGTAGGIGARRLSPAALSGWWQDGGRVRLRRWTVRCCLLAVIVMLAFAARWQHETDRLVGENPDGRGPALAVRSGQIVIVAVVVFVLLVGPARLLHTTTRRVARRLPRWLPPTVSALLAAGVVALVVAVTVDRLLLHQVLQAVDRSFAVTNRGTAPGITRPVSPLRSGGPGSLMPWSQLGSNGRTFVAEGPTAARIATFTGQPAVEPIRVYGGLVTDPDLHALAARVVRELDRTRAFARAVLCVAIPTGRGWIDEEAIQALEYMHGGNVATASMQYSYLPSALAFLNDPQQAQLAGRELFDQVYARWSQLPPGRRPRLVVFGESLGSSGIQGAFSDLGDVERRTGGALLVGPPDSSNRLWSTTVAHRDAGTPMIRPTYQGGRNVRFGADGNDLAQPDSSWLEPRIVFLQHASDPVVWWSPDLLFDRPDWLAEPRGRDVNTAMHWIPVVTFWQVTADMAVAGAAPTGHGHHYGGFAQEWSRIAPPPGWTAQDTQRLSALLARQQFPD